MRTIKIIVDQYNIDEVVDWFSGVNTNSSIDFYWGYENCLTIINEANKKLVIYDEKYTRKEEIFKIIEPQNSDYGDSGWEDSINWNLGRKAEELLSLIPNHTYTNKEIFDIYVKTFDLQEKKAGTWYVGDITLGDSENGSYFVVFMEIRAEIYEDAECPFKSEVEAKVEELYKNLKGNIAIPTIKDNGIYHTWLREVLVAKMLISLKGKCTYEIVDSLSLRKDHIIQNKYPDLYRHNSNIRLNHPLELVEEITEVVYDFPQEESWSDVMSCMGIFTVDAQDKNRVVKVCKENIDKTVRFMEGDSAFKADILKSLEIIKSLNSESEVIEASSEEMLQMVIAHELGHMVFRKIRRDLTLKQNESLANWFSCILADEYRNKMIELLTRYQSEEYSDFINIPMKYRLKKNNYVNYCNKVNDLLRSW